MLRDERRVGPLSLERCQRKRREHDRGLLDKESQRGGRSLRFRYRRQPKRDIPLQQREGGAWFARVDPGVGRPT
jgi:hypothetical protein